MSIDWTEVDRATKEYLESLPTSPELTLEEWCARPIQEVFIYETET